MVADFLIYKRNEKMFTVSTSKTYRSAIDLVLRAKKTDMPNSQELLALIRLMAAEIPRHQFTLPKWNLTLVLEMLLEDTSLKYLTHKCLFLLALTSTKRVSEMQAM